MNKLSVVIVTYNNEDHIEKNIKSLKKALAGIKSKIFVIDNNSSDKTPAIIKTLDGIEVLINKFNRGFGRANNQALKKIKSEYALLLNPDTVTPKNTIAKLLEYMDNHQDVGLVTCRVEFPSGLLDRACRRGYPTPWRSICRLTYLDRFFPHSKTFGGYNLTYLPEDKITEIDSSTGAFMLIRKKALDQAGIFDEAFFMYGEDIDLCYRIKHAGWKIIYNPTAKAIHYKGVSSGISGNNTKLSKASKEHRALMIYHFHNAMHIFYHKHYEDLYPSWLTKLVMASINLKMYAALLRLKIRGY